jgi:alkaline phosphatase D
MRTWTLLPMFISFIGALTSPLMANTYRIAFGSCAKQDRPQPVWSTIDQERPDVFLFIGDNVYADTQNPQLMEARYQQLAEIPEFKSFRARVPMLATWDDHDYGANDAGAEFPMKAKAQEIFLDFFQVPQDSPRRQQEGIYYAETRNWQDKRIQFILLDTRYFRSPLQKGPGGYRPDLDPEATLLGQAQWTWLEEQLRQPADLRIIASSIQFLAMDHRFEKWHNLPLERQKMLNIIARTGAEAVVFVSGDRHIGEISVLSDSTVPYPIFDLTASGLTDPLSADPVIELNHLRVPGTEAHTPQQYGLIELETLKSSEVRLTLSLKDGLGRTLETVAMPLSRLTKPQNVRVHKERSNFAG